MRNLTLLIVFILTTLTINAQATIETVSSGTSGDAILRIEADTDNNNENDNPKIEFKQDGGSVVGVIGITGDANTFFTNSRINSFFVEPPGSFDFQIATNNMARFIVNNAGNVGIGTTTPSANLEVSSENSGDAVLRIEADEDNNNENDNPRIELRQDGGGLGVDIGFDATRGSDNLFRIAGKYASIDKGDIFTIDLNKNFVGIGSSNPDAELTVKGNIHCEEVLVDLQVPADYVFEKYYTGTSILKAGYTMPTLEEVEAYTKENHHLPELPSAQDIKDNGLQLKEMTNLLLQKIEELTLYTIEQEKRIKALEAQIVK